MAALAASLLAAPAIAQPPPIAEDPVPTLKIGDARVREGQEGVVQLVFPVRLSGPPHRIASVTYRVEPGTATTADNDYEPVSGQLLISPVDTELMLEVPVFGDSRVEGNEWLRVKLSDPVGVAFADSEAFGIITNDEQAAFVHGWVSSTDYTDGTLPTVWSDFNGDGDPDISLYYGGHGNTFTEIPGFRELLANGNYHGGSACDYDRDGDVDVVFLGYYLDGFAEEAMGVSSMQPPTPNVLLQNQGDGTFVDVAPTLDMNVAGNGETAVWGDFNGDGWPDLFAPFYAFIPPYQCFFYRNNGDGTFTDLAVTAGVALESVPGSLRPEGAHAADWNDDGYLDIYCASHLFLNDGTGHFTDVREAVGLPEIFDEGSSFVDYDNDGDLDLYIRGAYWPYQLPHLFRNDAGTFQNVAVEAGITDISLFWGDSWADVDNDGDMDLLQHGLGSSTNRLMLNQGDGTFLADTGFASVAIGRELSSWGDADGDGDLDVVIGPVSKQILTNRLDLMPGFYTSRLRVRVLDAEGHETAHGATVRLHRLDEGPRDIQTRIVDGGSGYLSQGEYTVHFGGLSSGRFALEVVYPSAQGTRVVVDSLVNPDLGSIEAGEYGDDMITVYRDGRVTFPPPNVAGVPGAARPPRAIHALGPPAPTPARRSVTLPAILGQPGRMSLTIHDLSGRRLRKLDRGMTTAGPHDVVWDLRDQRGRIVPPGVYFGSLSVDGIQADTRRLVVVR